MSAVDTTWTVANLLTLGTSLVAVGIAWGTMRARTDALAREVSEARASQRAEMSALRETHGAEVAALREAHGKLDHKQRGMEQTLVAVVTRLDVMQDMLREVRDAVKGRT